MKKILLLLVILNLFQHQCSAQKQGQALIDSLVSELPKTNKDTNKVSILLKISDEFATTLAAPDSGIAYATKALNLSTKNRYVKGLAESNRKLGKCFLSISNNDSAKTHLDQALDFYQNLNDKDGIGKCYNNLGTLNLNQSSYPNALSYYLKAIKMFDATGSENLMSLTYSNIGIVYYYQKNYTDALRYYSIALNIDRKLKDEKGMAKNYNNISLVHIDNKSYDEALKYGNEAIALFEKNENKFGASSCYINMAIVYANITNYTKSIEYYLKGLKIKEEINDKQGAGVCYINIGSVYDNLKKYKEALFYSNKGIEMAKEINDLDNLRNGYRTLASVYNGLKDYKNAYEYQVLFKTFTDSIFNTENSKQLGDLKTNFAVEKKESELKAEQEKKDLIAEQEMNKQKLIRNSIGGGLAVVLLFSVVVFRQRNKISKGKKRSDELLLNILPSEVAEELKETGAAKAKSFDNVTVLFTDFKNFTQASEKLSAEELVHEINYCYSEFDKIITKYGIEKIKTIGDSYMCAGGLPATNDTHSWDVVNAGLELQQFIIKHKQERIAINEPYFELRLGIHTGPVVAGIVGIKKFAYDIWGDTVNTASRMESSGEVGKVNISGSTYKLVKDKFKCVHRGKVQAKNKGEIDMYFVEGKV